MKSILVVLLVANSVCADNTTSAQWEDLKAISHSNIEFSNSLYKVLSQKKGNLVFSPISIHMILALTSLGARSLTAQQMVDVLHLPADRQTTKDGFKHLTNALRSSDGMILKIANKIYTDKLFAPTTDFTMTARNYFNSSSETVDFHESPKVAYRTMNNWVDEQTDHKIKGLFNEDGGSTGIEMILINAIYFKGTWKIKFKSEKTTLQSFHVSPNVIKQVPMMNVEVNRVFGFKSSTELKADILEMPYVGDKVSLLIILPQETYGLAEVESKLTQLPLSRIFTTFEFRKPNINVHLPKFKIEIPTELTDILSQMGMTRMFSKSADFSGLSEKRVSVSEVIHKALIEVNEEGTVAAAATAVISVFRSIEEPSMSFRADHPFIFLLVNTESKNNTKERIILFMGRYAGP